MNKLEKALTTQDTSKQDEIPELSGTLGVVINGVQSVEVSNRAGFVYVLLNTNGNELVQAFNDKVSAAFGLAVIVVWNVNRYEVLRKDDLRYSTWNSSFLPKHGNQHSFNPEGGGGGDVSFIYGKQFVPLSLTPSGTFGGPVAIVAGYAQQGVQWQYIPDTPTPNLVALKPTNDRARMVLVCLDWNTSSIQAIVGTGTFAPHLTGSYDVIPYLPVVTGSQVPIAGVRLVSGTTAITWNNIYDVRQYFHPTTQVSQFAIQDEGVLVGSGTVLNFIGAGVSATQVGNVFNVEIPGGEGGGGGGGGVVGQHLGKFVATGTTLNVLGGLTASGTTLTLDAKKTIIFNTFGITYNNLPNADTPLPPGGIASAHPVSLLGFTQARLFGNFGVTSPFAGTKIYAMYSVSPTSITGSVWNFLAQTFAEGELTWQAQSMKKTEWHNIVTGAMVEDCWVRLYTYGGNGSADPTYGLLGIEFR